MAHLEHEELKDIYEPLLPTNKKVSKLIKFPDLVSGFEKEVSKHLQKYVRQLSERQLSQFLCYTTGSNLITCSSIEVFFSTMTEFARRPIGHTCGNMLELADSYDNYPDFRAEFDKVLKGNIPRISSYTWLFAKNTGWFVVLRSNP